MHHIDVTILQIIGKKANLVVNYVIIWLWDYGCC